MCECVCECVCVCVCVCVCGRSTIITKYNHKVQCIMQTVQKETLEMPWTRIESVTN